jgi:hypothetical protein
VSNITKLQFSSNVGAVCYFCNILDGLSSINGACEQCFELIKERQKRALLIPLIKHPLDLNKDVTVYDQVNDIIYISCKGNNYGLKLRKINWVVNNDEYSQLIRDMWHHKWRLLCLILCNYDVNDVRLVMIGFIIRL